MQTVRLAREDMQELIAQISGVSDPEQHCLDHAWIKAGIEREHERKEFWAGMRVHVAKWGAVSVLTLLGYLLWQGIKHYVRLP